MYYFIFKFLDENKLRIFRWKLLQFIVPTKKLLFQWKIKENYLCNFCRKEEDYEEYFLSCTFLESFWKNIHELLAKVDLNFEIKLRHLVFGYKIADKDYFTINYLLTIIMFSIYKSYYLSEQKSKYVNVYQIFTKEFNLRINEVSKSKMPLLIKIKCNF